MNITEQELEPITSFLAQNDIPTSDFYPVVRGRVNAVNGELVAREVSQEDNEKKTKAALVLAVS